MNNQNHRLRPSLRDWCRVRQWEWLVPSFVMPSSSLFHSFRHSFMAVTIPGLGQWEWDSGGWWGWPDLTGAGMLWLASVVAEAVITSLEQVFGMWLWLNNVITVSLEVNGEATLSWCSTQPHRLQATATVVLPWPGQRQRRQRREVYFSFYWKVYF